MMQYLGITPSVQWGMAYITNPNLPKMREWDKQIIEEICKAHANRYGSTSASPLSLSGLPPGTIDWEKRAVRKKHFLHSCFFSLSKVTKMSLHMCELTWETGK